MRIIPISACYAQEPAKNPLDSASSSVLDRIIPPLENSTGQSKAASCDKRHVSPGGDVKRADLVLLESVNDAPPSWLTPPVRSRLSRCRQTSKTGDLHDIKRTL